jgi:hypothetical protein
MLTVVMLMPDASTTTRKFTNPEVAALTVRAHELLGEIERVVEFGGSASECAEYSEAYRKLANV